MPNFVLLEDKVKAHDLETGDHVMLNDMLWRVIDNFPVVGGGGRMLMLAFHNHVNPAGYKFHPVGSEIRFEVFRKML